MKFRPVLLSLMAAPLLCVVAPAVYAAEPAVETAAEHAASGDQDSAASVADKASVEAKKAAKASVKAAAKPAAEVAAPKAPALPSMPTPPMPPLPVAQPSATTDAESTGFWGKIKRAFSSDKPGEATSAPVAQHPVLPAPPSPPPPTPPVPVAAPSAPAVTGGAGRHVYTPETVAQAKDMDPKALEVARKVVKLFDLKSQLQAPINNMIVPQMMMWSMQNPTKQEQLNKAAKELAEKLTADHIEEFETDRAVIYAQTFSRAELEQLKSFYETDAGKKLIQNNEVILGRSARTAQEVSMYLAPDIQNELSKILKKNGIAVPSAGGAK